MSKPDFTPTYPDHDEAFAKANSDDNDGWCINCGDWTHNCCESDGSEYECPNCGKYTVYSPFELLLREWVK